MCHQIFQQLNTWEQELQVEIMTHHISAFDIVFEDGSKGEQSVLKQLIHKHNNHQEPMGT